MSDKTKSMPAGNSKQVGDLQKDLKDLEGPAAFKLRYKEHISAKMKAGLREDQAIEVIKGQIREDLQRGREPHYKPAES